MRYFGVFETVRVENGKSVLVDYHYKRLKRSAKVLKIPLKLSFEEFKEEIEKNACFPLSLVRFTLFKDGKYEISCRVCEKKKKVSLFLVKEIRRNFSPLTLHKKIDIMDSLYAFEIAKNKGYDEALLLDVNGFISETAFANIFFVKNGVFFTPSLKTGCLPGTRREFLIRTLKQMGIPVFEGFYTLKDLILADEVFITSARYDVAKVEKIGEKKLESPPIKSYTERVKKLFIEN
jgi:branched-subunit amino acid aminotransferase/4-amino-4-deoxychorismate lyase